MLRSIFMFLALIFVSLTIWAQNDCSKPAHVGEAGYKIESSSTTQDDTYIGVQVTTSHWVCSYENRQYAWVPHQALNNRNRSAYKDVAYVIKVKKIEAYLGTQNYKTFQAVQLINSNLQTTSFRLLRSEVLADSPHGKLRFFLRSYNRIEFADGRVMDPIIDNSRALIVSLQN